MIEFLSYSILDVLESDWMKEERYDKNVYRAHMKQMKVNVDRSRAEKRNSAMNRDVEIDSIKRFVGENNKIGWKPTLRRLCENKYVPLDPRFCVSSFPCIIFYLRFTLLGAFKRKGT